MPHVGTGHGGTVPLVPNPDPPSRPTIEIDGARLEYEYVGPTEAPCDLVFLHEGLGSVGLWRDVPSTIAERLNRRGLVYSRRGHGWSSPAVGERRDDYLHHEAHVVLPEILDRLTDRPPALIGHSDGASIAILAAGGGAELQGIVLIAPHVFVEADAVSGIDAVIARYGAGDLSSRLGRHHRDADALFWAWADIWRSPGFADWNIEDHLGSIECPVLVVQAEDDEYATVEQVDRIASGLPSEPERVWLSSGGHSPHLTRPDVVVEQIVGFLRDADGRGGAASE